MISFSSLRNVSNIIENNSFIFSIDTLRTEARKNTMTKYINNQSFSVKPIKTNEKISANAKKFLWTKEVTSSQRLSIPNFKNIFLSTPHHLNMKSAYKKYSLVAFGLSQYNKPLHTIAKQELYKLFNKFGVSSFDLSIDRNTPIDISPLRYFGSITSYYSTRYINSPLRLSNITKICYYDKAQKDNLPYPLYRLELTIRTKGKLKDMFIPLDEIEQVLNTIA